MRSTVKNIALLIGFLVVLIAPILDNVLHLDPSPEAEENRFLTELPPPRFAWSYASDVVKALHNYGDMLGFRMLMTRGWNLLETHLWGPLGKAVLADGVVWGRDGWLFLGQQRAIDDYRRVDPFDDAALAAFVRTLETRRDWLSSMGCRFLFVLVPNKQTVYEEYYSPLIGRTANPSRLDQLTDYLHGHSDIEFLDLRAPLEDAKQRFPEYTLYHQTDSHWNSLGAFVGYIEMTRVLSDWYPTIAPLTLADVNIAISSSTGGGLAKYLALPDILREERYVQIGFGSERKATIQKQYEGPLAPSASRIAWSSQQINTNLPKAVIVGDSFMQRDLRFMAENFARSVFIRRLAFDGEVIDVIEYEQPDVVIQEMVERMLRINSIHSDLLDFFP